MTAPEDWSTWPIDPEEPFYLSYSQKEADMHDYSTARASASSHLSAYYNSSMMM